MSCRKDGGSGWGEVFVVGDGRVGDLGALHASWADLARFEFDQKSDPKAEHNKRDFGGPVWQGKIKKVAQMRKLGPCAER